MRRGIPFLSSMLYFLLTTAVWAQPPAAEPGGKLPVPGTFEGSRSLTLSNGTLELTFLPQGDVRLENGQIIIEDLTAKKQVRLAASLKLETH